MSSVSTVSSSNASLTYAQILANAQKAAQSATTGAVNPSSPSSSNSNSATNITLSAEAQAALASIERDFATVTTDARTNLDKLLTDQKLTSLLKDGKLAADLSKVDRRELYAISTNAGQKFTADEQKAAQMELQNRFDAAMAGPTAVSRVTGTMANLYDAALTYFDNMTPEEKASATYAEQRAALEDMKSKLAADPSTLPSSASDPVNQYMQRLADGETGEPRDIGDVASDARTTLDAQYKAGGSRANYKDFDSRSIASVALNSDNKFSAEEVRLAKNEMRSRAGAAVLAGLKNADASNPASFAQNIISLYGAMSTEERAAAGWTDKLYAAAVSSYATTSKLNSMLTDTTGASPWGGGSKSSSDGSNPMSIFSYM
jgi:hypothetical protein